MGNLVQASFHELASTSPTFHLAAKLRATAYLECYFLQEAAGSNIGQGPPSGHELEFSHRVKVAIDHLLSAKKEAYRIANYRLAYFLAGVKMEPCSYEVPSWAPERLQLQMKSLGPKLRTEPPLSAVFVCNSVCTCLINRFLLLDHPSPQGLQRP